jgi:branched-subunit amino acid transport protein
MLDRGIFWGVVIGLAAGTYLMRFSFLGILGQRPLPGWLVRGLRYTSVAVLPGLVAPAVLWPAATGGETDPARLAAALMTVLAGMAFRSMLAGIIGGASVLYLGLALTG